MKRSMNDRKISKSNKTYWYIATNTDKTIVHYGETAVGQQTETGQDILTRYALKKTWESDLKTLGITLDEELTR